MAGAEGATPAESARQRLDKWLWYARIVKSRTLAQKLIASGAVRVDATRVTTTGYRIAPGVVITLSVHDRLRVLRVLDGGTRRGPATEAQTLYEDLSPELPKDALKPAMPGKREDGAGRPTKKERRQIDKLQGKS